MSTQYRDGSWSMPEIFNDAMQTFMDALEAGTARAFHVGTPAELEGRKAEADLSQRVANLEALCSELKAEQPGATIRRPTPQELLRYLPAHQR